VNRTAETETTARQVTASRDDASVDTPSLSGHVDARPVAHRPLAGRCAVVTGGSGAIGASIVASLAARGADVVVVYARSRQEAEAAAEHARQHGVRAMSVQANLAEEARIHSLVRAVRDEFGRLDILVSGAVSGRMRSAMSLDSRGLQHALDVNVRALLILAQLATPMMKRAGWGRMVALSSMGADRVLPDYAGLGASKAALESMVRYLAVELAPHGITANTVSASVVETPALDHFGDPQVVVSETLSRTPSRRLPSSADVAGAVAFLCSDDAAMVQGQTLLVDGGYSLVATSSPLP
jgi:enoyl-[acyl-carrier protein] reductase III